MNNKKNVVVGLSKLLHFTLKNITDIEFSYVLDIKESEKNYEGLDVFSYSQLERENIKNINFYIFAVSNHSLRQIIERLALYGVSEDQIFFYSDLFKYSFMEKINSNFTQIANKLHYEYLKKEVVNSKLSVHTTICGNWLFLESIEYTKKIEGDIAEIGCYEGGNMLLALRSGSIPSNKKIFLFDSFEGFPSLSDHDPIHFKKGDYKPLTKLDVIKKSFCEFSNVNIVPGFVPETFSNLNDQNKYSLVFFDCDLYQPCLDTLHYFWPKLSEGGLILIHDYFYEPNGFSGVEKATDIFCEQMNISSIGFWESTMVVLKK